MSQTIETINMPPLPNIDLAQLCKQVRVEAGLTQEEIAKIIGTTGRSYRRWEAGELQPSGQFTAKILALRDQLQNSQ
ncbi:MAG: hypothetical protein FD167_4631 [bacterium]|nr:MAG: hypothetical protein FD167_4631 [bacterium]